MDDEVGAYFCRVMTGTGTATRGLTPMLAAWAEHRGVDLEAGTLNMCADRPVTVSHGQPHDPLTAFTDHAPARLRVQAGFGPRLYEVTLDGWVQAWLFRWSEPGALRDFVASQPDCRDPGRFCEIVSEVRLRQVLRVSDGDIVEFVFGWGA